MSNEENKSWYMSRTIWGSLVAIVASLIGFKYTITSEQQGQVVEVIMQIVTAIGGVLALYGRIKATQQIGKKQTPYNPDMPEK